jgi:hypothetical protein
MKSVEVLKALLAPTAHLGEAHRVEDVEDISFTTLGGGVVSGGGAQGAGLAAKGLQSAEAAIMLEAAQRFSTLSCLIQRQESQLDKLKAQRKSLQDEVIIGHFESRVSQPQSWPNKMKERFTLPRIFGPKGGSRSKANHSPPLDLKASPSLTVRQQLLILRSMRNTTPPIDRMLTTFS